MTTYRNQLMTVEAMKIEVENIHEVKKWVGELLLGREGYKVVVPVPGDRNAHIGEWVVKVGDKFKVMTDEEFKEEYQE